MADIETDFTDWIKAGKIAAESLTYAKSFVKPGVKIFEIADKVEQKIISLGAKIAFPLNISLNSDAAHATPMINDETILKDEVVKLDLGCHINGAIADTALTVDLSNKYSDIVKASRDALNEVIKMIRPGVTLSEVGRTVEETIQSFGLEPIRNLSGHQMERYQVHAGVSIPNFDTGDKTELQENWTVAIEPFATNGAGKIEEGRNAEIFGFVEKKPVRGIATREAMKIIQGYDDLPFATRWLAKKMPLFKVNFALKELRDVGAIRMYPVLQEVRKGIVSQAEHSVIVRDKPVILTKRDDE